MKIRKGKSGFYQYRFMVRGKLYRGSTEVTTLQDAITVAGKIRAEIVKGNVGIVDRGPAPVLGGFLKKTFMPYVENRHKDKPKTLEYYKYGAVQLAAAKISTLRLDEINDRAVAEYIDSHREYTASGVNQGLRTLRRALRLAYEWHKLERRATVKLAAGERQRDHVLTTAEERTYLNACKEPWKTMATISVEIGLRPGEIFRLKAADINWDDCTVSVTSGKSKAARRELPMTDAIYRAIKAWLVVRPESTWLFPSPQNAAKPYSQHNAFDWHHAALKDSGVDVFEPYCLRHTALTRLAKHCRNPYAVAAAAGHSSITMTFRYVHPQKAEIWEAFEQKSGLKFEQMARRNKLRVVKGNKGNVG